MKTYSVEFIAQEDFLSSCPSPVPAKKLNNIIEFSKSLTFDPPFPLVKGDRYKITVTKNPSSLTVSHLRGDTWEPILSPMLH